jgi:hypothetical protein
MKKISLTVIIITLSTVLEAQLYIQPYIGYMFSSHPLKVQASEIIDNYKTVYTANYKYGQGMNLGLAMGYNIKKFINFELNASTHVFSSFSNSTGKTQDLRTLTNFSYSGYFGDDEYQSKIYQIAPLLGYTITKSKFNISLKIGPDFLQSKITHKMNFIDWEMDETGFHPLNTYEEIEYFSNINIGLRSSICIDYPISPNLLICANLVSIYNNCKITRGEIVRYEIDGVNRPDKISETAIETNRDGYKVNFSQIGVNIGIKYVFRKE